MRSNFKPKRKPWAKRKHLNKKPTAKLSAPMKRAIKKIARGPIETKFVGEDIMSNTTFNSVITGAVGNELYRCVPLVGQGTNSFQRVGRKINPVKGHTIFNFRFADDDSRTRDITVVLFMYLIKQDSRYADDSINPAMSNGYTILDNGNGTSIPFNGIWQDAHKKFNSEDHTLLHKRVFRLAKPAGIYNGMSVVGDSRLTGTGMYSDTLPCDKTITLSFKPPKVLQYDDVTDWPAAPGQASIPTSFAPVWSCGYYYNDGGVPDTTGGILKVSVRQEMWFKDA